MEIPADGVGVEICGEAVAVVDMDHKLVPDHFAGVVGKKRETDGGVVDFGAVNLGEVAAVVVFAVDVGKFHVEHGSLNGVEPAVETGYYIMVSAVGAVIGKGADGGGEVRVGGGYGSGVAEGTDIFCRVEAECGGVAEVAGVDPAAVARRIAVQEKILIAGAGQD